MTADVLVLDFETKSTVDLRKSGLDVYARHPSTKVVCMGYAFNDDPVRVWYPGQPFPAFDLSVHIGKGLPVITHNAAFERGIFNHTLPRQLHQTTRIVWPTLTPEQTSQDTMIRAAYWGLPMKLEQVAEALGLPFGKDAAGGRAMMKVTKPKRFREDGSPVWWDEIDMALRDRVGAYCSVDVELERLIHRMLPPLPPDQVREFILDAEMNQRGLLIDLVRVQWLKQISVSETKRLDDEMMVLTNGAVPNTRAVAALKAYVSQYGVDAEALAKDDIASLLKGGLPPTVKDVLLLRQEAAKTSVAKLNSMEAAACEDHRVRGVFQFYGATRTGRYAGRLIQPQNYPRPSLKRDKLEEELLLAETDPSKRNLSLVSTSLRSCIRAAPGKKLVVVDFAQIEARVLAWLAGQEDILEVFASGEDVYTYAANKIGSNDRTLGKVATLGLGYGMGPTRFIETAKTYGLNLDEDFAASTVYGWRDANGHIRALWQEIDRVVKDAITAARGKWLRLSTCAIRIGMFKEPRSDMWVLMIELPSKRCLVYRDPKFDAQEGVSYMGLDQYTKKWTRIRSYGAKFVENIVQAVARDLMLAVMLEAETAGYESVGTVHDEGIWETFEETAAGCLHNVEQIIANLAEFVPWAYGLPMKGEGFVADRYGK